MRRSLFALFCGKDGRSLARALAALLFIAAAGGTFPGVHQAFAAGAVLCSAATDSSAPAAPGQHDVAPCCLALCAGSHSPALAPAAPIAPDIVAPPAAALRSAPAEVAAAFDIAQPFGPRGPPLLA